jgi:hypothetical protein
MTSLDLISSAMRLVGILGVGETPASNESTNALSSLNDMLDTWSNENLLIYDKVLEVFPLVGGQQSYTMGTGGNFNTARPLKIENAFLRTLSGSQTLDLPIEILNQDQWASISVKSLSSTLPTKLISLGSYPLETILLWPIPSAANSLGLWTWKPLSNITLLTTIINLPPGYNKALRYNLALELAPEYGREPSPLVLAEAIASKETLKRMNSKPNLMTIDAAALSHESTFNYLTGDS